MSLLFSFSVHQLIVAAVVMTSDCCVLLLTDSMDYVLPFWQIAPAETPDSKMRMVIVTGPPEAQFKVRYVRHDHRYSV